ncbi:hypothetical protein AB1282_25665 [Gottfriedia sp. S16(2024)]|uniref:hypothetical protein n=1 Tax=Gottfriedia sp. S16(2024) TaxID=3162883 RepID=UPI003D23AF99
MNSTGLTFGIYPLSVAGTPIGLATGPEDNYEKISSALKELKGNSNQLYQECMLSIWDQEQKKKYLML